MAEGIGVWSSKLDNPMGMEVEEKHMKRFRNFFFFFFLRGKRFRKWFQFPAETNTSIPKSSLIKNFGNKKRS